MKKNTKKQPQKPSYYYLKTIIQTDSGRFSYHIGDRGQLVKPVHGVDVKYFNNRQSAYAFKKNVITGGDMFVLRQDEFDPNSYVDLVMSKLSHLDKNKASEYLYGDEKSLVAVLKRRRLKIGEAKELINYFTQVRKELCKPFFAHQK